MQGSMQGSMAERCCLYCDVAVAVAVGVSVGVDVAVDVAVDVEVAVGVTVAVKVAVAVCEAVGGRGVNVSVAGWELWRVMRGLIHSAKSSCAEAFAKTVKMNLTFSPLNELRSILTG